MIMIDTNARRAPNLPTAAIDHHHIKIDRGFAPVVCIVVETTQASNPSL